MARVDSSEVLEIIDTTLEAGEIDVFVETASLIVDNYLADKALSDETLKEIEKYLAAHVLSVKDQRVKTEKIDVLSFTYTGTFGEGLKNTQYGQMSILLDSSGTLGALAEKGFSKKASMTTLDYHNES